MTLLVILTILFAKMLDPITAALSIGAGFVSRAWWHVVLAAVAIATVIEVLLSAMQLTRQFRPGDFLLSIVAAGLWAGLTFWIRQRRKRAKTSVESANHPS